MLIKVWLILLIYLTSTFAENLGNCFREDDNTSCENSHVKILEEFYECKMLQKFNDSSSHLSYTKGKIFLTVGSDKFTYDFELNMIIPAKYKISNPIKIITNNDITFTGGSGKVSVDFPEADESLYIKTYDEMTDDEFDLYKKSDILFILSRYPKENNINENAGDLYALNVKNISEENVSAEKIDTFERQFSSIIIIPEKDVLLLLVDETSYSKLISISLIPSEQCKIEKNINSYEKISDPPTIVNGSIVEILNEVDVKLVKILDKLSVSATETSNMPIAVKSSSIDFEKKFNDLKIKYNKLNRTFYENVYGIPAPLPQAIIRPLPQYKIDQGFQNQASAMMSTQQSNIGPPSFFPSPILPSPNFYNPNNLLDSKQPSVPVDSVLKMFFNLLKQERIYNMKLQNQLNKLHNERNTKLDIK